MAWRGPRPDVTVSPGPAPPREGDGDGREPTTSTTGERPAASGRNVLLVILDSVRASNTTLHSYERETTPFLERFASRATHYTQARAPSIHSIASHVSMFTGTHVEEHGAMNHTARIDTTRTIWHELAAEHGYATGLFTNNRIVSDASNLAAGFTHMHAPDYPVTNRLEDVLGYPPVARTYYAIDDGIHRLTAWGRRLRRRNRVTAALARPAARAASGLAGALDRLDGSDPAFKSLHGGAFVDAFLAWERRQRGPWAACINLMDTHSPYRPAPDHDRWAGEEHRQVQAEGMPSVRTCLEGHGWDRLGALEGLYDGTIHQADAIVADLVDRLEARDRLDDTLLVVTSDHGEAFGERSRIDPEVRLRGHKWGIHEVLTHVPLVVSSPGQHEGTVVDEVVSLTSLPDAFRAAATGRDPHRAFAAPERVFASTYRLPEAQTPKYASVEGVQRYVGPWRAVYAQVDGAVRKDARRGEQGVALEIALDGSVEVLKRRPTGRVREAYASLDAADVVTEDQTEIDDDLEAQLEHLGYIR